MSDVPPASADPSPPAASKRRRRRGLASVLALAASLFMWPAILQIEKLPSRVETLKLLGAAEADGDHGGGSRRGKAPRAGSRPPRGLTSNAPNYGALREGLPSVLAAQLPPATPTAVALQDLAQAIEFAQAPPTESGPVPPFTLPTSRQPDPEPLVGFPGPGGNPPVTNPPVVDPVVVNPPVTNPPVVDPGNPPPPVVTPPDGNPPVVPPVGPPPVTNPNPPVEGPGGGTFTPPGDPGGGDPGGGNPPVSGVPEPSVWMELILGAGLAGASLRRMRRQPVAIALRAASRRSTTT